MYFGFAINVGFCTSGIVTANIIVIEHLKNATSIKKTPVTLGTQISEITVK